MEFKFLQKQEEIKGTRQFNQPPVISVVTLQLADLRGLTAGELGLKLVGLEGNRLFQQITKMKVSMLQDLKCTPFGLLITLNNDGVRTGDRARRQTAPWRQACIRFISFPSLPSSFTESRGSFSLGNLQKQKRPTFFESRPWLESRSHLRPGTTRVSPKDSFHFKSAAQGPIVSGLHEVSGDTIEGKDQLRNRPGTPLQVWVMACEDQGKGTESTWCSSAVTYPAWVREGSLSVGSHCWQDHLCCASDSATLKCPLFTRRLATQFRKHGLVWIWWEQAIQLTGGQQIFKRKWRSSWLMHQAGEARHPYILILLEGCVSFLLLETCRK